MTSNEREKIAKKIIRQVLNDSEFCCGGICKIDKRLQKKLHANDSDKIFAGLYIAFKTLCDNAQNII